MQGDLQGAVEEMRLENVGAAFVAVLRYFNEGAEPSEKLPSEANFLYRIMVRACESAKRDYDEFVAQRTRAAKIRWARELGKNAG